MKFLNLERRGGAPQELYMFHRGTTILAEWTSGDVARSVDLSLGDPRQFLPVPISRDQTEGDGDQSNTALKVKLAIAEPDTVAITALYLNGPPSTPVELSLYRVHRGSADVRRFFYGDVAGAEMSGGTMTLNVQPKHAALQQPILRQLWQGPCNNQLYDTFCGVNKASFAVSGTVDTISADGLTIDVSEADAFADGYFAAGGLLEFGNYRGFIIAHTDATLTLFRAVPGLVAGSGITIYPGCDRTLGTCNDTFANAANHMGFPLIPPRDPFTTGVT